jgi:hypothetical protein
MNKLPETDASGTGNTVDVRLADVAHCPAFGVNTYVPLETLLTTDGDHVPMIPLLDVVASIGATLPEQNGAIAVNVGVIV